MRTGPVSTPNERGPVARGQVKGSERNMDGGWGLHLAVGGFQGDRGWHLYLVTMPSWLIHSTLPEFLCTDMMWMQERGASTLLKRTTD